MATWFVSLLRWNGAREKRTRSTRCRGFENTQFVQHHVEQRTVYLHSTAVAFNKSKLPESVHKEADAGARGTDHIGERFLANLGNHQFRLVLLAEDSPPQAPFEPTSLLISAIELSDTTGLYRRCGNVLTCMHATWSATKLLSPTCVPS